MDLIKSLTEYKDFFLENLNKIDLNNSEKSLILFIFSSVISINVLKFKRDPIRGRCWDYPGKISEIWIYPVKSCRGIQLKSASTTKTGFQYDRQFMLVDNSGKFITQRQQPMLSQIITDIDFKNGNKIKFY